MYTLTHYGPIAAGGILGVYVVEKHPWIIDWVSSLF